MTVVDESNSGSRYGRRGFLKRAGVGAGAVAASASGGVFAPRAQAARSRTVATSPTTFGRLFPDLPAFAPATQRVKDAEVVQEPTEQPYGVRDCVFRDRAGNLIRVQELR